MTDDPQLPEADLAAWPTDRFPRTGGSSCVPDQRNARAGGGAGRAGTGGDDAPRARRTRAGVAAGERRRPVDGDPAAARPPPGSRWRRSLFMPAATALAIVVAALVVSLGPQFPRAHRSPRRPASRSPPRTLPAPMLGRPTRACCGCAWAVWRSPITGATPAGRRPGRGPTRSAAAGS